MRDRVEVMGPYGRPVIVGLEGALPMLVELWRALPACCRGCAITVEVTPDRRAYRVTHGENPEACREFDAAGDLGQVAAWLERAHAHAR